MTLEYTDRPWNVLVCADDPKVLEVIRELGRRAIELMRRKNPLYDPDEPAHELGVDNHQQKTAVPT